MHSAPRNVRNCEALNVFFHSVVCKNRSSYAKPFFYMHIFLTGLIFYLFHSIFLNPVFYDANNLQHSPFLSGNCTWTIPEPRSRQSLGNGLPRAERFVSRQEGEVNSSDLLTRRSWPLWRHGERGVQMHKINFENGAVASRRYNVLKRISPIIPASNGIVLGSQGFIIIVLSW